VSQHPYASGTVKITGPEQRRSTQAVDNRFGFKDFVLLVLLLGVGVSVWLSMVQEDRRWREVREIAGAVREQGRLLAELGRQPGSVGAGSLPGPGSAPGDDSWARPGVPITRPGDWTYASDPENNPDYPDFAFGGTLTELIEGQPAKLTPYVYNDAFYARIVEEVVCEQLAMFDPGTLELRGVLADAWQEDPNGLWLRVRVRDGARFSDGEPVTAEDVRWTFMDFVFNPEIEAEAFRSQMNQVKSVTVVGEKVVEFEFHKPRYNNISAALRNPILPKRFYSRFTPSQINQATGLLMGSGPYRFQGVDIDNQWRPGQVIELVRNERYWGRRPPVDRLRYRFIADNTARLTEFENGGGDIMRATADQYSRKSQEPAFLEKNRALAWTNMKSGYAFIAWNCGQRNGRDTPFSDKRVRQAMTLMIDRERVNRDFYSGVATVCAGPFPPSQADPDLKPWPYDLDRARTLLTEAGWIDRDGDGQIENERGDRFVYEFTYTSGNSIGAKLAKYLADQGAALGIRVTPRVVDWSALDAIRNARDFDSLTQAWAWSGPEDDPFQILHSSQIANQGDNWTQWSSAEGDRLIEAGRSSIDPAQRRPIWRRFQALIHEEQPYTFLLNVPWIRFVSNRVRNVHPYPVSFDRREMYIPASGQ